MSWEALDRVRAAYDLSLSFFLICLGLSALLFTLGWLVQMAWERQTYR